MYACGIAKTETETQTDHRKNWTEGSDEKCNARGEKENKNIAPPSDRVLSYNYMQLSMLWFIMIFEQHYGD